MRTRSNFTKAAFFLPLIVAVSACGVKGKPLPPLVPPPLGRGEPTFPEATQDLNVKKKKPVKIEGDFDDQKDFSGEKE